MAWAKVTDIAYGRLRSAPDLELAPASSPFTNRAFLVGERATVSA